MRKCGIITENTVNRSRPHIEAALFGKKFNRSRGFYSRKYGTSNEGLLTMCSSRMGFIREGGFSRGRNSRAYNTVEDGQIYFELFEVSKLQSLPPMQIPFKIPIQTRELLS